MHRPSLRGSALVAAAAAAGAIVYWRAGERQRSRQLAETGGAITEGRDAAHGLMSAPEPNHDPFDQT